MPAQDLFSVIRRFLGLRLLLPTMLLFALTTAIIGHEQREIVTREHLLFSRILTGNVESFLQNARLTLMNLSVLSASASPDDFVLHMAKMHRLYPYFRRLAWVDSSGIVIDDIPSGRHGDDVSGLLQDALTMGDAYITAPYISPYFGELTVGMFIPMPRGGMILGELSLADLQKTIADTSSGQGDDVLLFITDAYGNVLAHPNKRLVETQANLGHLPLVDKARQYRAGFAGLERMDGRTYLTGVSRLANTGWLVVAARPTSAVYLGLAVNQTLIMFSLFALFSLIIYLLNRKLQEQVVTPLGRFSGAVALLQKGDYSADLHAAPAAPAFRELGVLQDKFREMVAAIVEREQSLTKKAEEQALLLDNIDLQVWFLREPDLYGAVNRAHAEYAGRSKALMARRRLAELFPADEAARFAHQNETVFRFREVVSYSSFQHDAQGRERILHITLVPKLSPGGRIEYVVCTAEDITERVGSEKSLRASLREKEVMLKEIHHRVKNNLQVVSSLLHLQSTRIDAPEAAALFAASQNRIMSMAYVHEEIYRSDDLAHINLKEYAKRLTGRLVEALAGPRKITLDLSLRDVHVSIDQAVPCGIILNELISNALEHAFTGRDAGRLEVILTLDQGRVRLMIHDNGVGLPPNIDLSAPSSLGLQLVIRLVDQLRGRMSLDTGPGARFRVEFPLAGQQDDPDVTIP